MSRSLAPALRACQSRGEQAALVVISATRGSTPREAGAAMLVTPTAVHGTIGGGRLEFVAIEAARELLAGTASAREIDIPLGASLGQCCGGHVRLDIRRADAGTAIEIEAGDQLAASRRPLVLVFGAGHVGRALVDALSLLPLRTCWIDERAEEFTPAPGDTVEIVVTTDWEAQIAAAPPGSACVILTHSHSLDALIASAALERGSFAYVGLIGSMTKRRRFLRGFRETGLSEEQISHLVCPIGDFGIRDKRPEVIAALVAAELLVRLASGPVETDRTKRMGADAALERAGVLCPA